MRKVTLYLKNLKVSKRKTLLTKMTLLVVVSAAWKILKNCPNSLKIKV